MVYSSIRQFQKASTRRFGETTREIFDKIQALEELKAFITVTRDAAIAQAEELDRQPIQTEPWMLKGVPISIKDNFCTKGVLTTAGSKMLSNFVPAYESFVTAKAKRAGAICVGKTNMDEFGMGSSTENSHFGLSLNPRALKLGRKNVSPGGSSGGAAASIAAQLCLGALATDTGGSIRQPASYCGVVGMKPTYGLCSRWGIISYASSLDQAGVIARTVEDVAVLIDTIVGVDHNDSTSVSTQIPCIEDYLTEFPRRKYRVGIPEELRGTRLNDDLESCWNTTEVLLKDVGCEVQYVSLATLKYSLPAYYIIALSEASTNLARYDGVRFGHRSAVVRNIEELYSKSRGEGFNWETKKRIMMGTYCLSKGYNEKYYEQACKVRRVISNEFKSAFETVDCLILPTTPTSAFEFDSHTDNSISMYLEDMFTVPVNLAGLPAISIPVSIAKDGLPMSAQVIGPRFGDADVCCAAAQLENHAGKMGLVI